MKTLELNQMENLQGGELSSCQAGLLLGAAGVTLAVFAPWSYLMMAGVAVDTIGMLASCDVLG